MPRRKSEGQVVDVSDGAQVSRRGRKPRKKPRAPNLGLPLTALLKRTRRRLDDVERESRRWAKIAAAVRVMGVLGRERMNTTRNRARHFTEQRVLLSAFAEDLAAAVADCEGLPAMEQDVMDALSMGRRRPRNSTGRSSMDWARQCGQTWGAQLVHRGYMRDRQRQHRSKVVADLTRVTGKGVVDLPPEYDLSMSVEDAVAVVLAERGQMLIRLRELAGEIAADPSKWAFRERNKIRKDLELMGFSIDES